MAATPTKTTTTTAVKSMRFLPNERQRCHIAAIPSQAAKIKLWQIFDISCALTGSVAKQLYRRFDSAAAAREVRV